MTQLATILMKNDGWFEITGNRMARLHYNKDVYAKGAAAVCDGLVSVVHK